MANNQKTTPASNRTAAQGRTESDQYDVIIIGGGLVGASLACALAPTRLKVAVVEARALGASDQPSYDDRTVALAYSSKRIFEAMGVWSRLERDGICPIKQIHITDRGRFGCTRLHADDAGLPALGYVAENRVLGAGLYEGFAQHTNIRLICPAEVSQVERHTGNAVVEVVHEGRREKLNGALIVLADGGRSGLREQLGFGSRVKTYAQTAVVTNVTPGQPHEDTAYERFTTTGPLAVLPMGRERCAVVWSTHPDQVQTLLEWDDETFLAQLQARFGWRLGRFSRLGKRQAYPLELHRPSELARDRVVLVGNAAHTVHPVGGQGFNYGLRDVATLAQVLSELARKDSGAADPGAETVLHRYSAWRRRDDLMVPFFTDSLVRIFSTDFLPLAWMRNLGLLAVEICPPMKRAFTRRTSGLMGRLPRLARGLPLVPGESADSGRGDG